MKNEISDRECDKFAYMLLVTTADIKSNVRLVETLVAFLQFDDAWIVAKAEALGFIYFEYIKQINYTQFLFFRVFFLQHMYTVRVYLFCNFDVVLMINSFDTLRRFPYRVIESLISLIVE